VVRRLSGHLDDGHACPIPHPIASPLTVLPRLCRLTLFVREAHQLSHGMSFAVATEFQVRMSEHNTARIPWGTLYFLHYFRDVAHHHTIHADDTICQSCFTANSLSESLSMTYSSLTKQTNYSPRPTRRIESTHCPHRRTVIPITYTRRGWAKERRVTLPVARSEGRCTFTNLIAGVTDRWCPHYCTSWRRWKGDGV